MKGPINCLSFSHGGELLASGGEYLVLVFSKAVWNELVAGDDGTVRVWEISTKKCLQILEDSGRRWGQFTCLTWLGNWGNDDLKPIAFGTGRGLIVIYRRPRIDVSVAWKLWIVFIDTSKVINGWTGKQPCIWGKRSSWVDSVRHQEISPCNNKPPRSYCHIWYRK